MSSVQTFRYSDLEECLMCNLRWKYDILQLIFPIKFYCKHSKHRYSPKPLCRLSKALQIFSLILQCLFALSIIPHYLFLPIFCQINKLACLSLLSDQIFITTSIIVSTVFLVNMKNLQLEFNSWLHLFENPKNYNLGRIIGKTDHRKFRIFTVLSLLLVTSNACIPLLYFYYSGDNGGTFFRKISMCASFAMQGKGFFEMLKCLNIHGVVLKAFERSLKTSLSRRQPDFRKFYQTVSIVNSNVKIHLSNFTFIVSAWSLVSTICMIINIFIWIRYSDGASNMVFLHVRTMFIGGGILAFLVFVEVDINRKVSARKSQD